VGVKLIALASLYIFVRNVGDVRNYLFVTVFAFIGNNIFNFIIVGRKTAFTLPGKQAVRHLTPLLYIFSTTIAASIYSVLDTVMLGFITDETSVGLYAAAVKVAKVSIPLITSAGLILIPQISKKIAGAEHPHVQSLLDNAFRFFSFFSVPIMIGMMVLAPECILVFSGKQFTSAITSMQIVSALPVLIGFGFYFASLVLIPGGKHKQTFISVVVGLILSIALNIILVPLYRHDGASVSIVATEFLVTVLYFYFARKYFRYTYDWKSLLVAIICASPFILIVALIRWLELTPLLTLGLSVFICGILYFALQYLLFNNTIVLKVIEVVLNKLGLNRS